MAHPSKESFFRNKDMMPQSHSCAKWPRGQAAVELAFSVPLLIVLLLVVVETGRICLVAIALSSAARAGVQYGAQNLTTVSDSSGMQNAAKADAPNLTAMTATGSHYCQCSNGSASTCLSTDCASSHRLTYVEVNTSATYTPLVNWPGVPTTTTLTSEAIMRVNQ
jgi:Flp pilus assembly protein TadG